MIPLEPGPSPSSRQGLVWAQTQPGQTPTVLLQGRPKLPLALGSASIPSAVPWSAQETGGREAASLVQGDSALPLLGFPPGTTLETRGCPGPPGPLSAAGVAMVQRLLLGVCSSPAVLSPPPVKRLQARPWAGSRRLPCLGEPEGPASSTSLKPVASSPPWLSIEACGGAADVCPCPLVLACGCVRPWRECPPLGLTAPCAAGGGACTPAGEGRLQVLN